MPGVSRRLVVGVLGTGAVAGAAGFGATVQEPSSTAPARSEGPSEAPPFLRALVGQTIARWTVVAASPIEFGAARVVMRGGDALVFHLEVLARDPSPLAPRPPGVTDRFAVHVDNGGDGALATDEEQGKAAMALAEVLARQEASFAPEWTRDFLTYTERLEHHRVAMLDDDPSVPRWAI